MEPPTFEFVVPLASSVELGEYSTVRIPYEPRLVEDSEVDDVIERMRSQNAVIEPVERTIQEGDRVNIQISARRVDPKEGEEESLVKERSQSIDVQSEDAESPFEWPYLGFSRNLIDHSTGDAFTVQKTLPEDYPVESLQGVNAEYSVVVQDVKSRTLPEINDELAQSFGEYSTLDELRTAIREDLEAHALSEYHQEYDDKVLEKILEVSTVKYPQQMLEHEIDLVIERLQQRLQQQNMDIDLYLKTREMDLTALRDEARPVAETRLKRTLTLLELADKEKIDVQPDELEQETARTLDEYARYLPEKEFRKLAARENANSLVSNIMMDLMIQKTLLRVRDIARGVEKAGEAKEAEPEAINEQETVTAETSPEPAEEEKTQPNVETQLVEADAEGEDLESAS